MGEGGLWPCTLVLVDAPAWMLYDAYFHWEFMQCSYLIGGLIFNVSWNSVFFGLLCSCFSACLGLAARGGKFVFTRGGLADEPYAEDWAALLAQPTTSGRAVATAATALGALLAAAFPAARRPLACAALATGALAAVKSADGKRRGRRGQRPGRRNA